MRLDELVSDVGSRTLTGDPATDVAGISYHSAHVRSGDLFCCLPGADADGHDHAAEAVEAGAAALLVERPLQLDVPQVLVRPSKQGGARAAMAICAANLHGHPSRSLTVVGITGTNGKTTTAHLLGEVFAEVEGADRVRVMGTLTGVRTTPEAPDLQAQLASWRDEGVGTVVMEVSSHALEMHRVDSMHFSAAVFTNLSRDHLDFHGTMEAYFEAKSRLFSPGLSSLAVLNLDSPYGRLLKDVSAIPVVGYSLDMAHDLELTGEASRFTWREHSVELHLGGRFNVANALAAGETAVALGVDPATVAVALGRAPGVAGRFERVDAGQDFSVIVDYAHTPDGLEQVLGAAGELVGGDAPGPERPAGEAGRSGGPGPERPAGEAGRSGGQVAVVFGCGGDRDPTKRPLMGAVAARMADRVVLTSDNSRGESTQAIIDAVKDGYVKAAGSGDHARAAESGDPARSLVVEPDRRAAIAVALSGASPGDVVVVAGKGHETTLTIGDVVTDFDDRVVVREELERLTGAEVGA